MGIEDIYYKIVGPSTTNDFLEEIKDLKSKQLLIDNSISYIESLLEYYAKDGLDSNEVESLRNQLEKHQNLKKLNDDFLMEKEKLSYNTKKSLRQHINELSKKKIFDGDIEKYSQNLENNILDTKDTLFGNTTRDYVEKYISFSHFSDNIIESDKITNFLEKFTIEYLNIIENKFKPEELQYLKNNLDEGLYINKTELDTIIKNIDSDFNEEITFTLFNQNKVENHKINPKAFVENFINQSNIPINVLKENIYNKIEKKEIKYKEIELGILTKNNNISKLFRQIGINYFNIRKKIEYIDASGLNNNKNSTNIEKGSKITYKFIDGKYKVLIYPPILLHKINFEKKKQIIKIINNEAKKNGFDSRLIKSIIGQESKFGGLNKSSSNYKGYMQLKYSTSIKELLNKGLITEGIAKKALEKNNNKYGLNKENIIAGTRYLKLLYEKYDGYNYQLELAMISYNRGPTKISNLIKKLGYNKKNINFEELTNHVNNEGKNYVKKILNIADKFYGYKIER